VEKGGSDQRKVQVALTKSSHLLGSGEGLNAATVAKKQHGARHRIGLEEKRHPGPKPSRFGEKKGRGRKKGLKTNADTPDKPYGTRRKGPQREEDFLHNLLHWKTKGGDRGKLSFET